MAKGTLAYGGIASANDVIYIDSNANQGIGTVSPTATLEVEQASDGGVVAFKVDNNDTDKIAMSIEASNIDADVMNITADALTTSKGIHVSADGLTTGSALYVDSDASSTGTRSLAQIRSNHGSATGTTGLEIHSAAGRGLFIDSNLAAGGYSLEIDAEITTANTAKIAAISTSGTTLEISSVGVLTGKVVDITADAATTGKGINMSMDGLTTGSALYIDSDSDSTSARNIVEIINNNTAAKSAVGLKLQQDSGAAAAIFDGGNIYVRKGSAFQTLTTSAWAME